MTHTHATVVATVALGNVTAEQVRTAITEALAGLGVELVPCGWAPDPDTICDATDLEFDELVILDLNPNLVR